MNDKGTGGNGKDAEAQLASAPAAQSAVVAAQFVIMNNGQLGFQMSDVITDRAGFMLAAIGFLAQAVGQERTRDTAKNRILRPTLAVPPLAHGNR